MISYQTMTPSERATTLKNLMEQYQAIVAKGLSLNMSRGVPSQEQLDLSMPLLSCLQGEDVFCQTTIDERNYGHLDGLPAAKALFADLLEVSPTQVIVGGNSSLNLMYDTISRGMMFGMVDSPRPWGKEPAVKCLCPVPGYDRHFAISQLFGIEMIPIAMTETGPDMDTIEQLVASDPLIKFIWCVPKYSNPQGITYSPDTVHRFASMKTAACDFRIIWDNAYYVHDLCEETEPLENIMTACHDQGNPNRVIQFVSTSKITFSGAGIAALIASEENLAFIRKQLGVQIISYDKINQLAHVRFLKNKQGIFDHMAKHRAILAPKFDLVIETLERELTPLGIGQFYRPKGGYFVSFDAPPGCAKRTVALCKQAGVALTAAGATYPLGQDPTDQNIRIAPTFPTLPELEQAMSLFCLCVKIAVLEQGAS